MKIVTENDDTILLDEINDDYASGCAVIAAALRVALNRLGKQGNINDVYEEVLAVIAESRWSEETGLHDAKVALGQ